MFGAGGGAFSLAVSGTGTAGMETAVANITAPGARALVVVTGYFGDRLAQIFGRYGATVSRVDVEWGRACDPARSNGRSRRRADIVAMVHAETSTGVLNPVERDVPRWRRARRVDRRRRGDVARRACRSMPPRGASTSCYSCSQKGLGAPSGLAPIVVLGARAVERQRAVAELLPRSALLEDYWVGRKYHHTISAPLIYALREALMAVEEEGLERAGRGTRGNHLALADGAGGARPRRCCRRRRAALVAECGEGARRRRRGCGAPGAARRVQHRDRRRPRTARRKNLARRADGSGLDPRERAALPHRARAVLAAAGYRRRCPGGDAAEAADTWAHAPPPPTRMRRPGDRGARCPGFACRRLRLSHASRRPHAAHAESRHDRVHGAARARGACERASRRAACSAGCRTRASPPT